MPYAFGHERLVVYQRSTEFYRSALTISGAARARDQHLADQLKRAASSISLNIAEGAGEFRKKEKARFYRMALRSASECASILDLIEGGHVLPSVIETARSKLEEITKMLTKLILRLGTV